MHLRSIARKLFGELVKIARVQVEKKSPTKSESSLPEIATLIVNVPQARLDQFLALTFPSLPLARIRQAINAGNVRVNSRQTIQGWIVKAGDKVTHQFPIHHQSSSSTFTLEVLFEDRDLIVINKPVGLQTHPSANQPDTLMNALAVHLLKHADQQKELIRPMLLHRLDRETSGVLAIAKSQHAARELSKAFQERCVSKQYLALVYGVVKDDIGEIDAPIGENKRQRPHWRVMENGSPAQTRFTVKERFEHYTLLELEPLTGRTHQLRIHCTHIGHAIVGDQIYKGTTRIVDNQLRFKHQLLHAYKLAFRHPR
ncbi:MAG TPA: RluA family pseudouridine synthase, partial [Blastocatellia bacterium]|nr:RluA family pseudouridine synthase [Blastocatellia bacterium]